MRRPASSKVLTPVDGDAAEAGLRPASDSCDPILGFPTRQEFSIPAPRGGCGTRPLFSSAIGQFNGRWTDGCCLGDTLRINRGTPCPLTRKVGLLGRVNFLLKGRDGEEFLYLLPRIESRPSENWRVCGLGQILVYQQVNFVQAASNCDLLGGASVGNVKFFV